MLLSAEHLSINFGSRQLLEDVNFYLNEGDKVGVIGINGTGKSTFLKVLAGKLEADAGTISRNPNVQVSLLEQNPPMEDDATVLEQVFLHFPKEFRELNEYEAKTMLNKLGLPDYEQKVGTLSGGQRKRVALAAALMWAVYSILIKKYTEQYDNFIVTRRVFLWAFLTAVPLMLLTDGMPDLAPLFTQPKVLISWLFLGVMGNAVCFAIWNIAFKALGVVVTNNYLYASPFVTVFVGWLLLGEPISVMSIIGAVLITVGVIFAYKTDKPKAE